LYILQVERVKEIDWISMQLTMNKNSIKNV
jgi:hypothetical protein